MDLHEQLLAAVNARLEVARAATPGPWTRESNRSITAFVGAKRYVMPSIGASEPWPSDADADYIARHDPADAIRRYERDLRVLERHYIIWRDIGWRDGDETEYAELPVCGRCVPKHSHFRSRTEVPEGACDEIRDLATAYGVEVNE